MKIGIMSMQRICNYGSFLQAYALKQLIESLGHEVLFVDYRPGKPVGYKQKKKNYLKSLLRETCIDIVSPFVQFIFFSTAEQRHSLNFRERYKREFLPLIGVHDKKEYNTKVDVLIIGSDEVFNCLQNNPLVGFSEELFGKCHNANSLISYAASFGNTTYEGIRNFGKVETLGNLLMNFNALSVRDENSFGIIKALTNIDSNIHLDPVLVYDFKNEIVRPKVNEEYIVVYAYRNRLTIEEKKYIKDFAIKENKKLYAIGGYQDFCDCNITGTPFEILGYMMCASFVITDTFHGTIFAVISGKKFVTFVRKGNGEKYGNYEKLMDLLRRLGLEDRGIFSPSDIEKKIFNDINYSSVNHIIEEHRNNAIVYLKSNLL